MEPAQGKSVGIASLKATLGYVDFLSGGSAVGESMSGTMVGLGLGAAADLQPVALDETIMAPSSALLTSSRNPALSAAGRSTVLPRRMKADAAPLAEPTERPRFDRLRVLGEGAMGEVELVRDNDIRRTVALKRVRSEALTQAALLRFADEVRIVGQLEHPGIVPVYDVGSDADGQLYLVMKHLQGETLESIIDKLRAGDTAYTERFPHEFRVHVFLGVLDAMRYAHARGVLHRDLKPANIMIGPFGEVTVMDWGIAKPIRKAEPSPDASPLERTFSASQDQRLLETQLGSLAGTPLYMSPEQAGGHNDDLDERSDVYALCMLFYEWLVLEHPLREKTTVTEVLAAIIGSEYPDLVDRARAASVPLEYIFLIKRGLLRDRDKRLASVAVLEQELKQILDGRVRVQCHVTLAKRASYAFVSWVDRNVALYSMIFLFVLLSLVGGLAYGVWSGVRALL